VADEKLGAVIGVWHDDCIAETEDVVRMNAVSQIRSWKCWLSLEIAH